MFIVNAIGSFLLDHWIIIAIAVVIIGVVIRFAYYASNPIATIINAIEYVKTHRRTIAVVVVVAIPVFYIWHLHATINTQQTTIATQQATIARADADIKILKDNASTLESAVTDANAMISMFDKFSRDTKITFDKMNQTSVRQNAALALKIQTILTETPPLTCEESIQYLISAAKGYAK